MPLFPTTRRSLQEFQRSYRTAVGAFIYESAAITTASVLLPFLLPLLLFGRQRIWSSLALRSTSPRSPDTDHPQNDPARRLTGLVDPLLL